MAERPTIGGQAVLEGVMMRSPERVALAVRRADGTIVSEARVSEPLSKKHPILGWPVVRGVVNFGVMLKLGMQTITRSAEMLGLEEEKPSKFEEGVAKITGKKPEDVMMGVAIAIAVVFALGVFIVLPSAGMSALKAVTDNRLLLNIGEGAIRMALFLAYLSGVSLMKEMRRVYQYHGAEHKVVMTWERGAELTMEECKKSSRFHPRCGTSFLFLVIVISILCFSLLPVTSGILQRVGLRLLFLPVVAGVSYEILRLAAKRDNAFVRAMRAPGLWLQRITTREPDEGMIEVALAAFMLALGDDECEAKG